MHDSAGWEECSKAVSLRLLAVATDNLSTKSITVGGQHVTRYALESPLWQLFQTIHVPVVSTSSWLTEVSGNTSKTSEWNQA